MRTPGILPAEAARILRFGLVGASVAAVYAAGYAGLRGLAFSPWTASALAFAVAVTWQYLAQTAFTFRAPVRDRRQLLRFAATILSGFAVSTFIAGWAGPALGLAEAVAVLIVVLWLPVQNYLIFRLWVYRDAIAGGAAPTRREGRAR